MKLMGNGEGMTALLLTDAESRLIRATLERAEKTNGRASGANAYDAFNRGVQRGTERIKAEFDQEQRERKAKGK